MRVVLMHNPSAGTDDHSAESVADEIRSAGHDVIADVSKRKELRAVLSRGCDLVAVAGGDGTIGKAAEVLRGTGVPLVPVPRGTANNIAGTLGVTDIGWWDAGEVRGFDVGVAVVNDARHQFIEGLGFGAFPRVIVQTNDDDDPPDAAGRLARDLRMFAARVIASPLRRYEIDADSDDVSGEYFLVEVLNIPTLGPRVPLAPDADPWDGRLDLVLAGDAERDHLLAAIDALARGENRRLELPTRRIERARIEGDIQRYHRDGTHCEERTSSVSVAVEPGALLMLAPPAHRPA